MHCVTVLFRASRPARIGATVNRVVLECQAIVQVPSDGNIRGKLCVEDKLCVDSGAESEQQCDASEAPNRWSGTFGQTHRPDRKLDLLGQQMGVCTCTNIIADERVF